MNLGILSSTHLPYNEEDCFRFFLVFLLEAPRPLALSYLSSLSFLSIVYFIFFFSLTMNSFAFSLPIDCLSLGHLETELRN